MSAEIILKKRILKKTLDELNKKHLLPRDLTFYQYYDHASNAYTTRKEVMISFFNTYEGNIICSNLQKFAAYLIGIEAITERDGSLFTYHPKELNSTDKRYSPIVFSLFIKRCFVKLNSISSKSNPSTYKKTIPQQGMSFFLTFFKAESELAQALPTPVPTSQKEELENLILNENLAPEDRFLKLIELIMRD